MTAIAAVIPCYNAAEFLGEALDSIWAQTRPVARVLVVDDGSTDATVGIAEAHRRAGHPVEVLRTPRNGGPATARNVALAAVTEPYVAFLDADDVWIPEHCALVAGLLDSHSEAPLAFGRSWMLGEPAPPEPAPERVGPADMLAPLLTFNFVPQSAVIARHAAVREAGGYVDGLRYSEDYDLWLRLALTGPFVGTTRATVHRRRHAAQASAAIDRLYRGAWETRARFWRRIEQTPTAAALEPVLRGAYELDLGDAWRSRSRELFRAVLALGEGLPGLEPVRERWRRRERWLWPAWAAATSVYDRLPAGLLETIRRRRNGAPLTAAASGPGAP